MLKKTHCVLACALLAAGSFPVAGGAAPKASPAAAKPARQMVPARTLACEVGRATNFDPSKWQKRDEIIYEGRHAFRLFLPPTPKWEGPRPDPSDDPLPVDPKLRILQDPSGLTKDSGPRFLRVVDLWPERVEMVREMKPPLGKLIIVSDISPDQKSARITITSAADAASLDINRLYSGMCTVAVQG
jgi:hypothetical protein